MLLSRTAEGVSHGGGWQHLWLQSPLLSCPLWVAEVLSSLSLQNWLSSRLGTGALKFSVMCSDGSNLMETETGSISKQ